MNTPLHILTNMAFWQSSTWTQAAESIYRPDQAGDEYGPCSVARKLFARRKSVDVIHTMGARESLAYGILCTILMRPSKQIMTEVFIDDVENPGLLWTLKTALYRLTIRRSLGVITNSSLEIDTMAERYRLPRSLFHYLPLNTNIQNPEWVERNDGYIFSAGRTLRDYDSLIAAVKDLAVPVHIVCGTEDLLNQDLPDHVTLHREIGKDQYLDLLKGAALVALPLLPTERSTGQVVMLEAMALGKPVITSVAPGTVDYMTDGVHGRLLPPEDVPALRDAVTDWLAHPEKARDCARRALERIENEFTVERHAEKRLHLIKDICSGENSSAL